MNMIQIFGAVAFVTGLFLFFVEQWTSGRRGKDSEAGLKAWKIELGGPPSLIAMGLGALMIVLPVFVGGDEVVDGRGSSTTTSSTTTTVVAAPETTVPDPVDRFTTPTISATVVKNETIPWVEYDFEYCSDWAVFWYEDLGADFYYIQIAAMGPNESRDVEWEFEGYPPICGWEIYVQDYDQYWIWITPVLAGSYGDTAFVEFFYSPEGP